MLIADKYRRSRLGEMHGADSGGGKSNLMPTRMPWIGPYDDIDSANARAEIMRNRNPGSEFEIRLDPNQKWWIYRLNRGRTRSKTKEKKEKKQRGTKRRHMPHERMARHAEIVRLQLRYPKEVMERFGVSIRTAYKDLSTIYGELPERPNLHGIKMNRRREEIARLGLNDPCAIVEKFGVCKFTAYKDLHAIWSELPSTYPSPRQRRRNAIVELGLTRVHQIVEQFHVSTTTARRDLNAVYGVNAQTKNGANSE